MTKICSDPTLRPPRRLQNLAWKVGGQAVGEDLVLQKIDFSSQGRSPPAGQAAWYVAGQKITLSIILPAKYAYSPCPLDVSSY
jgi:hypothetical protein